MNVFDYLFEKTKYLKTNLLLGSSDQVSYEEVYESSLKLAQYLKNTVGTNEKILIIIPNSLFFITAYLAILKSGNICVPLNPDIEKETIKYVLLKCHSKYIFASKRYSSLLEELPCKILDDDFLNIIPQNIDNGMMDDDFNPNNIAEIIFTSGSTGMPKGVMLSHKNIIANTNSIISYLHLNEKDIMLVVLPFYYCYGLSLLHTHIRVGGSLVLNNSFMFLGKVINNLKEFKCTGFAGVPSHFQILLRQAKDFKNVEFPDLKYVTQAGGKLHNHFISEFIEAFPKINFYVMYGQTEATARLSYLSPYSLQKKIGSIGKSIPDVELKIVDSSGSHVKNGETGEIIAKGNNIMLGYFDDEEATKQVIRNGWLHTGDLGKVDDEGFIYITGRKKEIIKIRGNRISSNEIEEIILQIPNIINCSVSETVDETIGETIKAEIIVNDRSHNISVESIQDYCSKKLASYKIPRIIEIKTNYELTGSGKKFV